MKILRPYLLPFAFCVAALFFLSPVSVAAQNKTAETVYRRVALMGEPTQAVSAQAEHITIEAAQTGETVTKFWRGVSLESNGAI